MVGHDWVGFGDNGGIVEWLKVCDGWEHVARDIFVFVCGAFARDHGGKPFDVEVFV